MIGLVRNLLVALVLAAPVYAQDGGDPVFQYTSSDDRLNSAIEAARQTLPLFFDAFNSADALGLVQSQMLLKVAIPHGDAALNNREHIWCVPTGFADGRYSGLLANAPQFIPFEQYDEVSWDHAQISDWMYFDANGKIHGAYTIRAMMPDFSKEQRAEYAAMLAPLPES